MSGELVPLPTFEGRGIRVIEKDGTVWMPLVDLAEAWGLHRNTLRDIVQRNEKKFEGFVSTGAHETCAGLTMVDERGLYLLMGAVNTSRLKNPQASDAILRFQRWVPELIQRYRKKEIVPVKQPPGIHDELKEAARLAETCCKSPEAFQAAILRKHGKSELADALQVPSVVHGEPGIWFNPTQLVTICNDPLLTAERLNWYLANNPKDPERHPFQYRDENRLWRLTPLGMEHGEEYSYPTVNKHVEIRIRWRESILLASGLVRPIANDQTALTAKAGA